ncbi:MAG: alpha/beta hydrolase fold domain-containing protein [Flavobacteriaceae bacterium]|nr:alpha/beta hydrolase fold domain-containing protein [Flavobacteriaceae bacterium]
MIKETSILHRENKKPIQLDVSFNNNGKQKPILIFCHGYKGFKDWGCWNVMASRMANEDFFFLKFNFSHNGGTMEQPIDFPDLNAFGENNFTKELEDLENVISWITSPENKYSTELNPQDVILVGHSRGGGIVTIKASEDDRVTKLITLAGASDYKSRFPTGDQLAYWRNEGVAYVENGRTKQQMPHFIQFYDNFIENEARLTISTATKKIRIPYLIIHGTTDETVTFQEAEALHNWNVKSELFAIENANHVFGASHPWENDSLPDDLEIAVNKIINFSK